MKGHKSGYAAPPKPRKGEFADVSIAIVGTRWNVGFIDALTNGAKRCLKDWGVPSRRVKQFLVPGAFELPLAVSGLIERASIRRRRTRSAASRRTSSTSPANARAACAKRCN